MTAAAMVGSSDDITASTTIRHRAPWPGILATAWVIAYALFIATRFVPALSEPDDNGYFAQGTLLAETGRTWFASASDAQYVGMHWLLTPDGKYVSRYPPGLAVLIAAMEKVGGWRFAALANPLMAIAGVAGFYLLARRVVGPWWALAGAVLLGTMPEYVHHGLGFDSHTAVAFCVIGGLYFLVRWSQDGGAPSAMLAGLLLGCIPTVRYPDAVMALGIGTFLLAIGWRRSPQVAAALLGALIPVTALAIRNQLVMGAFWRTGYALTHEQTGFSWAYFRQHAIDYVRQLNSTGVGPLLALGLVGVVWMISTRQRRWLGVLLAGMALPMALLYMAYYWAPQGGGAMTMRFLVPTFPLYVLAGVWALAEMTRSAGRGARVAVACSVLALHLLWGVADTLQQTDRTRAAKDGLARVTDAMERLAGRGGVVVGNPNLLQHLDFVGSWKLADASLLRNGGGMRDRGGPDGDEEADRPSPRQAEKDELRRAKYAGSQSQREKKFAADVATWAAGAKVYFVGGEEEMKQLPGHLRVVERVRMPEPPPQSQRGGMMGGPGMGPGGPGGPGGGRMFPGMRGGPAGPMRDGGRPMGGGGMMGGFGGLKEVVVAEWET